MLEGIIIVAVGHAQYGRMAYNLALSIKSMEDVSISIIRTEFSLSHLSQKQLELFDNIIDLPFDAPIGCGAKLWANLVTPYERTILLDADMLWLPERYPSELFTGLKDAEFTAITEGYSPDNLHEKYFLWADPEEIKSKYDIKSEKLYQWRSEVMYFTKKMDEFFKLARQIYLAPGLATEKLYGNTTADELAIVIAAGIMDIHPHEYKWVPAYWYLMNGGRIPELSEIYSKYYMTSFGANQASGDAIKLYDKIMQIACYKKGLPHVFPLISKKSYLPERARM